MATLRKKGRYYYARFYDPTQTPSRKEVALRTTYKSAAIVALREKEEAYAKGDFDPWSGANEYIPGAISVQEAILDFLHTCRHKRPWTQKKYASYLKQWKGTLPPGLMLASVQAHHIQPYLRTPKLTANALRARARHLSAFLNWSVKTGHLQQSPMQNVETPKEERKVPTYLAHQDVQRILRAIEADFEMKSAAGQAQDGEILWLRDIIVFAVSTGLRREEICALRWQAVNLSDGILTVGRRHITKSHHERPVFLAAPALEVLHRLLEKASTSNDYVFSGKRGGKLNGDYVGKQFKRYVRLAKLPEDVNFHSLRHTCASWLVMKGVPIRVVQEILGHSSATVTQRYAHLAPGAMREAMEMTFDRCGMS